MSEMPVFATRPLIPSRKFRDPPHQLKQPEARRNALARDERTCLLVLADCLRLAALFHYVFFHNLAPPYQANTKHLRARDLGHRPHDRG